MSDIKSDRVELRIRNQREIDFSLWFLKQYHRAVWDQLVYDTNLSLSTISQPDTLRQAIAKAFKTHFINDPEDSLGTVRRYILAFNERVDSFVDLREHQWLRDKLACYWVWFQIRFFTPLLRENIEAFLQTQSQRFPGDKVHSFFFEEILESPSIYSALSLSEVVIDHPARAAVIQTYFDRLPVPRVFKLALLENLEREFTRLMHNRRTTFLPLKASNVEMCKHAWEYVVKDKRKMRSKKNPANRPHFDEFYTKSLHPGTPGEIVLAVQVLHLTLNLTDRDKCDFKENYRKAWEGKNTRLNKKRKGAAKKLSSVPAADTEKNKLSKKKAKNVSQFVLSSEKRYASSIRTDIHMDIGAEQGETKVLSDELQHDDFIVDSSIGSQLSEEESSQESITKESMNAIQVSENKQLGIRREDQKITPIKSDAGPSADNYTVRTQSVRPDPAANRRAKHISDLQLEIAKLVKKLGSG
ncbi:TPA: hypothetical protein N6791_003146 [Escherichia coli]|uniref:hypothetical protein n=1 Tax=Escherichia coli TaxID=562 RepID=UPI000DDF8A42|nr:hypothetical protein [Escherichia coli]EEW7592484.1 hypothetical protein [Escherichia coli]RBJ23555.1 hypothetical protein DSB62_21700 [Escherichia coli]HCO0512170.1 hypothetical protein [Escherichia coli]HCO0517326.1 hypothetical protein [Escherichia coli]HCP2168280.1 hypothetical protein [Escherichia coli]